MNEELAKAGISEMYALEGLPIPKFVFAPNVDAVAALLPAPAKMIRADLDWVPRHMNGLDLGVEYDPEDVRHLLAADKIRNSCRGFIPFERVCFVIVDTAVH